MDDSSALWTPSRDHRPQAIRCPRDRGKSIGGTAVTVTNAAAHDRRPPFGPGNPRGDAQNNTQNGGQDRGQDNNGQHQAQQGGPFPNDFIKIQDVPPNVQPPRRGRNASTGLFLARCGRNENGHRNPDNFIVAPGVRNGAHHTHDYVGNLSTDGFSTNDSLAAADTTCRNNDKSTYFWPVLRLLGRGDDTDANADGGGKDGNRGKILTPTTVQLQFRGNPTSKVTPMPRFLRVITGDAKAATNGPANAHAAWTCTGFTDRVTTKYPLCPRGSQVLRILDFPSCWDGRNTDSANHRTHIVFPQPDGACPPGFRPVPQLRMVLGYTIPPNTRFAIDSFPEQLHNPITDHADFANVMPTRLMNTVVTCINTGRRCT